MAIFLDVCVVTGRVAPLGTKTAQPHDMQFPWTFPQWWPLDFQLLSLHFLEIPFFYSLGAVDIVLSVSAAETFLVGAMKMCPNFGKNVGCAHLAVRNKYAKQSKKLTSKVIYVCTYVCMCVWMYACIYVLCMCVCICVFTHVCMYVCMYLHMCLCMYVCMYLHMCVCMYVCTYVCTNVYMFVCILNMEKTVSKNTKRRSHLYYITRQVALNAYCSGLKGRISKPSTPQDLKYLMVCMIPNLFPFVLAIIPTSVTIPLWNTIVDLYQFL